MRFGLLLVTGCYIASIVGLISSVGVTDKTARDQLVTMLFLPVPLMAALALGLSIGGYRIPALVCLPVILAIGMYGRRFGPRGSIAAMLLFPGYLVGFLSHGAVRLGDLGWLAAEIGVGVAVAIAVRFALFYPRRPGPSGAPSGHIRPGPARSPPWPWNCSTTPGPARGTPAACTASSSGSTRPR